MATLDKRRQVVADGLVKMEGLLRSEASELKRVKPPREASLDWFSVLVVIRQDAVDLDLSASDLLRNGGQPYPPLAQQPDPSTTKFLKKHGLSVCLKYRQTNAYR